MHGTDNKMSHQLEFELDRIFSSLGYGMYIVNLDRKITLWGRAAEGVLGWTENDALGKDCREFIGHQNDLGERLCDTQCPLRASMDENRTKFSGTVWAHKHDGTLLPVNVSCAPLFDEEGKMTGAVEILLDMTREKELDRMKEDLSSAIAYKLKSPLTSIRGFLELLIDEEAGAINDEQRDFLGIIQKNTGELLELVTDFLDLDRLKSSRSVLHWEQVRLDDIIQEAIDTHIPEAREKGLRIHSDIEASPPILGDPELLKKMVFHLLGNAVQYTIEGEIRVTHRVEGRNVMLAVSDTGIGIPEDELDRIGRRFFRASNASIIGKSGSGLGIAITREIIDRHGGVLTIKSSPGKGSTFTVTFSLSKGSNLKDAGVRSGTEG